MTLPGQPIDPNPPATLTQALARSVVYPIFCVEITAGHQAFAWSLNGGGYYTYPLGDGTGKLNDSVDEIVNVYFNGTLLTQVTTLGALVPGSWMWDYTNQRIAMISPGSVDPRLNQAVVLLMAMFRFSNVPTDINGKKWRAGLLNLPALQNKVAADFNGITQIGGGRITFTNEDHFFDARKSYNWDAGTAILYMGASGLAWGGFQTLATWTPTNAMMNEKNFVINIQEAKVLIDTLYPATLYDSVTYPNMDPNLIGNVVQVAYGVIRGVAPVCVDTVALIFKVAGHAITSFDGVRVRDNTSGIFVTKNFASTNISTGQFTMSGADWAIGQDISVDFSGKALGNGRLMLNAADIVSDLIQALGQSIDTSGFLAAHNWFDVGYANNDPLSRVCVLCPSLYLDTQAKALGTIQDLMTDVRCYLTSNNLGKFSMIPFRNYSVSTLPSITREMVLDPGIVRDGSGSSNFRVQAGKKVSESQIAFDAKGVENFGEMAIYSSLPNLYTRNQPAASPVIAAADTLFTNDNDALYLAQALVNEYRVDPYIYTLTLKWIAFPYLPGAQHLHVVDANHNLDVVCEIIQVQIDLMNKKVQLILNNLRGFEESSGFWVGDSDTTPSGAVLTWPANGQLSDPSETQYRRHQAGHWHEPTNDFAVVVGSASQLSDLDHGVSRWQ